MENGQNNDKIMEDEIIEEEGIKEKLKKIREELKACEAQKSEYLAGWQRAKADFINARKDDEKARMEFIKFAGEGILREILAVADSLEIAGDKYVYAQLREVLKKQGVEPIEAKGARFDPVYHEALEQVEVSEKEKEGVVLEELQKGYTIHDKVLQPAKVKVGVYKHNK